VTDDLPAQRVMDSTTAYDRYIAAEGVPVIDTFNVPDLKTIELGPWPRTGCAGAIVRFVGSAHLNDAYVLELPPGGQTNAQRHMYEELVYVVAGRGATTVWNAAGSRSSFEWKAGSFFAIPLNCWYQHFNGDGAQPARYFAVRSAPLMMNLIHNDDFIFNLNFDFVDRFGGDPRLTGDFSGGGTSYTGRLWETNFVPDVMAISLQEWRERGVGSNVMLEVANSSMCGHVSEFPVGTYKKAHRHGPGANVIVLKGSGYTLLWAEGEAFRRVDWAPGSVVVPPERWFHQHFNTGPEPARYLAMRWGSQRYRTVGGEYQVDRSVSAGGDQIEYEDEDPAVRELFEAELARHGVESGMNSVVGPAPSG
jgi:oxalate decarboxylase/phosphoglucose isomerase-like protein (cupin superfamily)